MASVHNCPGSASVIGLYPVSKFLHCARRLDHNAVLCTPVWLYHGFLSDPNCTCRGIRLTRVGTKQTPTLLGISILLMDEWINGWMQQYVYSWGVLGWFMMWCKNYGVGVLCFCRPCLMDATHTSGTQIPIVSPRPPPPPCALLLRCDTTCVSFAVRCAQNKSMDARDVMMRLIARCACAYWSRREQDLSSSPLFLTQRPRLPRLRSVMWLIVYISPYRALIALSRKRMEPCCTESDLWWCTWAMAGGGEGVFPSTFRQYRYLSYSSFVRQIYWPILKYARLKKKVALEST